MAPGGVAIVAACQGQSPRSETAEQPLAVLPLTTVDGLPFISVQTHNGQVHLWLLERAWIVGQLLAMFSLGLLTWIGLWALGAPYPIAFGVFTGVVAIVPFFGTLVARRVYVHRVLEGKGFRRAIRNRPTEIKLPGDDGVLVHPLAYESTVPLLLER